MTKSSLEKKFEELEIDVRAIKESNIVIVTKLDEMKAVESTKGAEMVERRTAQKELNEDVEKRMRKLERLGAIAYAYGGIASLIVAAFVYYLFQKLP